MTREGLQGRCGRRKLRTTVADPTKVPAAALVRRQFNRDQLDQLWVGDATYIPPDEGWLFLATVIDACSRRLLGSSITDHLRAELCLDALFAAVGTRGGTCQVSRRRLPLRPRHPVHLRRVRRRLRRLRITQSMGTVGDNAMAESFFARFKRGVVDGEHFATRAEACSEVFAWCVWYNSTRLHTSIGNRPPIEYEAHLTNQQLPA